MKLAIIAGISMALFSSVAQAEEVCSIFDGDTIGTTHTVYSQSTNHTTNNDIYGETDVFYGGDLPSLPGTLPPNDFGAHASAVASDTTYDLTALQSITVSGTFYNSGYGAINKNFNESYLGVFPAGAALANPIVGVPTIQREGIVVGNGNGLYRGTDNVDNVTPSVAFFGPVAPTSPADILATWYDMSATFAIVGTNFVLTDLSVNGTTVQGFTIIGPTANYPWLNNMQVTVAADDAARMMCVDPRANGSAVPTNVPTLSHFGLVLLSLFLFGFSYSRRNKFKA